MTVPLRAYWATASLAASVSLGDRPLFLFDHALRLGRVVVLVSLWRVILADRGAVDGVPLGQILVYTLIAEAFAEQLNVRSPMASAFWEGTVIVRFLRPLGLVGQLGAEMVGQWTFGLITFTIPLLAIAPLVGIDPRPAGAAAAALFAASLLLAIVVGLALDLLFGILTVALEQPIWMGDAIRAAVGTVLSGSVLPLFVLPWGLGAIIAWLPFASAAAAPLQVYIGVGDPFSILARQLAWAIVLWWLVGWLWRRLRERLVGYGG